MVMLFENFIITVIFLAAAHARNKSPLLDDDNTRVVNKAAECIFGKQVLELGATWVPDLGVPIGVQYCFKCECLPFHRKRRVVAKVQCRNIKSECPEPTCEEPVLLPGRCCKTCPGDTQVPEVLHDVIPGITFDEEEKSTKHFAALLSGRSSLVIKNEMKSTTNDEWNKNNVVATGRFTFHKKNLYYSFYISDKAARPRSLQFVNKEGTILEEFALSKEGGYVNSVYQNATRKVCGVWRRLPRDYRRLLKEENMYVVLVWGEFTVSGQVKRYVSLGTELFSSLLEPAPSSNSLLMAGAGGTAIVSTSTVVSPSIHIAIIFNGIFMPDETYEVPVEVTLSLEEKNQIIIKEKIRVKKPAHELNEVEISSPVSPADLRLLTRGRLVLSISSLSKPSALRLSGNVVTKTSCELFQTALNSATVDKGFNQRGVSGLAWLYLNNEGSLVYNVQVDGLNDERQPVFITLVDVTSKRKMELEDLTPSFYHGWANGTIDKLSPKVLEPLYSGNLAVNVATVKESSLIKGKLSAKLVADARDAPAPVLLKREDYNLPSSAVGIAWITIDNECHLHYDVTLSGLGSNDRQLQLYMDLLPMIAPGAPVITKLLDEFQGMQVEGSPTEPLLKEELDLLDSGVGFIKVKENKTRETLLAATLKQIQIPQTCFEKDSDNVLPQGSSCLYEGTFYKNGAQWTSTQDPCTMCYCEDGNPKCDTMICPDIDCPQERKVTISGECCPVCCNSSSCQESNTSIPKGCTFGGRFYSAGSKFHPFLIPNGFDLCTECACDPLLLEVKCSRKEIGRHCNKNPIKISENYSYVNDHEDRQNEITEEPLTPTKSPKQVLAEGGCKNLFNPGTPYENGTMYHPIIASLGEYKCVTCVCKNGKQVCERLHCNMKVCEKIFDLRTMLKKGSDTCCTRKQCKKYRLKKRSKLRNHNG